jgi:hypothetical protein
VSEPVKKTISEILADNPKLRVTAIRRHDAKVVEIRFCGLQNELQWNENWNAWSHRPARGIYQQIIIFVPEVDAE